MNLKLIASISVRIRFSSETWRMVNRLVRRKAFKFSLGIIGFRFTWWAFWDVCNISYKKGLNVLSISFSRNMWIKIQVSLFMEFGNVQSVTLVDFFFVRRGLDDWRFYLFRAVLEIGAIFQFEEILPLNEGL